MMKQLRLAAMIWIGNAYPSNRRYWGWISMKTAWQAAGCLVD